MEHHSRDMLLGCVQVPQAANLPTAPGSACRPTRSAAERTVPSLHAPPVRRAFTTTTRRTATTPAVRCQPSRTQLSVLRMPTPASRNLLNPASNQFYRHLPMCMPRPVC